MKKILVFTLNGCPLCEELKRRLREVSIDFYEVEITQNPEIWNELKGQINDDLLPTIFIQTDHYGNGFVYTPEVDFNDINEIIEIIKNNI